MTGKDIVRFWTKVIKKDGCWGWIGATPQFGYGRITIKGKVEAAHRISWQLANGPIPKGLWVLHKCDNPPCCNPEHLFLGTHLENLKDCFDKGRHSKGEGRHTHKLTESQVLDVLSRYKKGVRGFGHRRIAEEYGVFPSTIQRIVQGKTWKHIQ